MSDYFEIAKQLTRDFMAMRDPVKISGCYQGMPLSTYIDDPAPLPSINASIAHTILTQSALHAKAKHPRLNPLVEREDSSRLDIGTIAHALLLEDDASRIVVIDAEDWRTKSAKEQRDAAWAAGHLPILSESYQTVKAMVAIAKQTLAASEVGEAFTEAIPEQTLIWEEDGVWHRSRPDKATPDWRIVFDYKTSGMSAAPNVWAKGPLLRYGYDLQSALARRGIAHLFKQYQCTFIFIVQEIDPPYAVSLISLDPQWIALADAKLQAALATWRGCLRTGLWPGYPSRVAYLQPPAWAENDWTYNLSEISAEDIR